jgi:hypothetical protein
VRALREKITETHLSTQFAELRALLVVPTREPEARKGISERAPEKSH